MDHTNRRLSLGKLILTCGLLFFVTLSWHGNQQRNNVQLAVSKGQQLYDMAFMAGTPLTQAMLPDLVEADPAIKSMLTGKAYGFLNAVLLTPGETQRWRDSGCRQDNCAHVSLYNYTDGGTINAVVNLDSSQVVGRWADPAARPGGSAHILPKAFAIAAADPQVQSVLGDIGEPDPAMIPMSGWLMDDDCQEDWCVDLTYHDPAGSGRIYHIFVNMQKNKVARTFFTRGREERSLGKPLSQRSAYSDGCHEEYGWNVCWEMTAHDGINFRDAIYDGHSIFSSVKISQVEAWYPAWPGGYRDEIGFSASVPPFGGTNIVDLGNGFEVSQLFTEFTHWPNCICCYRYEEIIRFYADGSLELDFVSHGPGCDDIPSYRPFWRIDLDLDGPENDQVWVWQEDQWVEANNEVELHPFIEDLSPEGDKVATFDGDLHYRWKMLPSDPLGRDESRFFILQKNDSEGDGPIVTGPGDTYRPPRQWIDGETPSGGDIVLWFVPILKQLKGDPWWCMPDPEPEFSPCKTILRAEPAGELHQPTEEELVQLQATPTATATPTAEATLSPDVTPTETPPPVPTATPRPLEGGDVETIILGSGCNSCHTVGVENEGRLVGPDLSNIGNLAADRITGMSAEMYLREAIVDPNAYILPDCPTGPCMANIMPVDYGVRLSDQQVETLVQFLLAQKGEPSQPTIIGSDTSDQRPTPLPKAFPAPKRVGRQPSRITTSLAIQILLLIMVFLLSFFRLIKQFPSDDS